MEHASAFCSPDGTLERGGDRDQRDMFVTGSNFQVSAVVLSCTVFKILKIICFSIMAVLICIHIICILYYNILNDSMIILDHGNICVDTNFMILSCIICQILTKLSFSIMAVIICINIMRMHKTTFFDHENISVDTIFEMM